jgi:creatinase
MTQLTHVAPNELQRLQTMHNGQKTVPTFSAAEMTRRQDGLRAILADLQLDAAILTSYHGINYYSDFLYCSFGRRFAFVVTETRATSVSAGIDAGQPWRRTSGDNITYTDWRRDNYFHALQTLLPVVTRIGIEFDHVNLDLWRLLQEAFPCVEFVDIGQRTMWQRAIKSAEEIALIREGARTADLGGAAIRDAIREGASEHEVALIGTQAMPS